MKLLFIASECVPFASTGGLGDVVGALPKALAERGHTVARILPMYRSIREGGYAAERIGLSLEVHVGLQRLAGEAYVTRHDGVETYLIRRDEYFDRSHLYSMSHRDYDDNFQRFVFFQKAAVELIDRLGLQADVVHAHDWQAGLIPFYLRHGIWGVGRQGAERTVFTIHNLAYQGVFPGGDFPLTGLPYSCFSTEGGMEFYSQISCMKAGIISADEITTVSPTYAQEIQTEAGGFGLHGVLRNRGAQMVGILNGIDTDAWNPSDDEFIKENYDAATVVVGKAANKAHLQRKSKLAEDTRVPLIGMVTRLTEQKGIRLLEELIPALMEMDVQLVLLGSGAELLEEQCREWPMRWPDRVAVHVGFNTKLAHRIYAGSDLFLVPSVYEPCGLGQLYAMRYGAIPVVHRTGGLTDTVLDEDAMPGAGTGFVFSPHTAEACLDAIRRACRAWEQRSVRRGLQERGMARDATWARSAQAYEQLYGEVLARARG